MHTKINRWRGAAAGAIGGVAATLAMGYAMPAIGKMLPQGDPSVPDPFQRSDALDDIALAGQHHREGESSTVTVGRIAYTALAGAEPQSDETRRLLSQEVHWAFGTAMGALYGAARAGARGADLAGGMTFGAGVWLLASELALPLLGISRGPTSQPIKSHAQYMLGHLVYGATLALVSQTIDGALRR